MRVPSIDRPFGKASLWATTLPLLFAALLAGCASRSTWPSLEVPLVFRPEVVGHGKYEVPASPGLRLSLPPVSDERDITDKVGNNLEVVGKDPRPIFATGQTPAEFLHSVFKQELTSAGYTPVSEGPGANRVLSVHLKRFFTTETNEYFTEIVVGAEVRDQSGAVLWQGQRTGTSRRFGRSMSTENYQEGFSDAALIVIADMMKDKQFQAAMTVN